MISKESYKVGALLYAPALKPNVARYIINNSGNRYSMAFCLEDTVSDDAVEAAEKQLKNTLLEIRDAKRYGACFFLPQIFVRVRKADQITHLCKYLGDSMDIVSGFILPKFNKDNGEEYVKNMKQVNEQSPHVIYAMPILESEDLIDPATRMCNLMLIRDYIDEMEDYVLNIRVGGNDFSNQFSVRRKVDQTIYDILPIAGIFSDILAMFSRNYIVSGPVWEYFSDDDEKWETGLEEELKKDLISGFVGKTVIHPKQIEVVNRALRVQEEDFKDAVQIMGWEDENRNGYNVSKSADGHRMNEVRTHRRWAEKVLTLAEIYGTLSITHRL